MILVVAPFAVEIERRFVVIENFGGKKRANVNFGVASLLLWLLLNTTKNDGEEFWVIGNNGVMIVDQIATVSLFVNVLLFCLLRVEKTKFNHEKEQKLFLFSPFTQRRKITTRGKVRRLFKRRFDVFPLFQFFSRSKTIKASIQAL